MAPVWGATGGGSAMGDAEERGRFLTQVKKACRIGGKLRDLGVRPYGIVRIDSAASPAEWAKDPKGNTKRIAETFREACAIAAGCGRTARRRGRDLLGAGCTVGGAMWSCWRWSGVPRHWASRPIWRTLCSSPWATTLRRIRLLPNGFDWPSREELATAYRTMADALRPWTIDFHVAQNDGTVKGAGSHDKTGRHCPPGDPNGKLDIVEDAGAWMRDGRRTDARLPAHLLGWLHVPERHDARSEHLERSAARRWWRCAMRTGGTDDEEAQHRHDRLRVHGPDPLECVPAG